MSSSTPAALLVDYGEVISEPQPPDAIAAMASLVELEVDEFTDRYWRHRPAYDRGEPVADYWARVRGGDAIGPGTLEQLIKLDVDSWCVFNGETLELLKDARRRGSPLALLSNAPHELAETLDRHPNLAFFDCMIFSSWIGAVKPEPAAFEQAVAEFGKDPSEIIFIDDRPANVRGAIDVGLRAIHFTSAAELRLALAL